MNQQEIKSLASDVFKAFVGYPSLRRTCTIQPQRLAAYYGIQVPKAKEILDSLVSSNVFESPSNKVVNALGVKIGYSFTDYGWQLFLES